MLLITVTGGWTALGGVCGAGGGGVGAAGGVDGERVSSVSHPVIGHSATAARTVATARLVALRMVGSFTSSSGVHGYATGRRRRRCCFSYHSRPTVEHAENVADPAEPAPDALLLSAIATE